MASANTSTPANTQSLLSAEEARTWRPIPTGRLTCTRTTSADGTPRDLLSWRWNEHEYTAKSLEALEHAGISTDDITQAILSRCNELIADGDLSFDDFQHRCNEVVRASDFEFVKEQGLGLRATGCDFGDDCSADQKGTAQSSVDITLYFIRTE